MIATKNLSNPQPAYLTGYLVLTSNKILEPLPIGEYLTIGRDGGNQLALPDDCVSSRHIRIEKKSLGFVLRDLRSRNGTYVNGVQIQEAILRHNDRIQIGNSILIFISHRELNPERTLLHSQNMVWRLELEKLPNIANSPHPILLTGPSGSGKDVLAQWIHRSSPRGDGPLISVNCSALAESLVESELFGHIRGSFTGAIFDRKGAFEAARGGTLFLDEIGDLPLSLQPKLLRALENNEIQPLGSDLPVKTNIRLIAATHQDLARKVALKEFREDLFFRLNVLRLSPPALTQRMEDFDQLLYTFCKEQKISFSVGAIHKLKTHSWPGNIRELKNVVSRAKAYFPDRQITEIEVDELLDRGSAQRLGVNTINGASPNVSGSIIKELEKQIIIQRLIANNGNQRRAATDLGMPKSSLNDRIRQYGINVKDLIKS